MGNRVMASKACKRKDPQKFGGRILQELRVQKVGTEHAESKLMRIKQGRRTMIPA